MRYIRIPLIYILVLTTTCICGAQRLKVGLVLSGGGARGLAHIGTLHLLDSLNIPIDYIAGTSMGGIIGALYAVGYSGENIKKLGLETDWNEVFTDRPTRNRLPFFQKQEVGKYQLVFGMRGLSPVMPTALIRGQKISLLFSRLTLKYANIDNFTELPTPFCCIAVDLVTGNEVVLQNGSLAKAMRSTMSLPSIFSPVEWGDSLLIDGGLSNNLPTDVMKEMGADIIIAVDVGEPFKGKEELESIVDIFERSFFITGQMKSTQN